MGATRRLGRAFLCVVCIAAGVAASAVAAGAVQTPSPQAAQTWPRYNDPYFALLAPIDALRRTATPRQVLAELDRLQPQIDKASVAVQSRALMLRGMLLRLVPDLPAAERAATEARTLGARAAHPYLEFDSLMLLFGLASDRGDLEAAAARLAEAVPIADITDDDQMRLNVRLDQGRIARARGRGEAALIPLNEAVEMAARLKNLRVHIQALGARSSTKLGLSDYNGALADAQLGYDLAIANNVPPDLRGASAFSLGQTLSQVGDLERGLDLYTDAAEAYTQANLLVGVSLAIRQRMDVRFALEDYDGAALDGERARELFTRTGSAGQEPAVLSRLALIEARRGRPAEAAAYTKDVTMKAASAQPRVRTAVESDLASAALFSRDFTDATTRFARVLEQARALRDLDTEWRAQQGLGSAALGRRDLAAAQSHFEAAVAVIDRVRRTLPEAGLRADFIAERLGPYDGLIATQLARSTAPGDVWVARAFETAERARGRALADRLGEAQARLTDPAVAKVRTQESEFGKRLSTIQQALADAKSDPDRRRLVADLQRAEREYDAFIVRIRRDTPRYAALTHPRASTTATIASGLAADEALVSFWIGSERSIAWVVTRGGLTSHQLPGRRDLDRDVARLNSAIAAGQIDLVRRVGASLHQALFAGVDYARVKRIVVVPDGPLWRAPFAAFATDAGSGWLIQRASLSVVPSASLLATLSPPPPPAGARPRQSALVFGLLKVPDAIRALRALYDDKLLPDRPLAYAAIEAENVARLLAVDPRTSLFLNDRADETSFKRVAAQRVGIVHVASHAMIDDRAPRRSALVLASSDKDDGLLQLNEIANLQLDADLVVLSTCQSQLGRVVRGEGLESLSRAFILGGARAVAASLWAVDDRETSRLMPLFYKALSTGAAPDAALRTAQLQMIQTGGSASAPSSWAGFVVMGRANRRIF